ncbi:phosphoribosylanthranilate isomerase [Phycisphaerales bacterium]|nr:phosphoribosylanthranilate isomerase [Phycisphaerales bacterium]
MARTRVKVCGIRTEDALFAAADSGADAVGFMFVKTSPRYLPPEEAYGLMSLLPPLVSAVGVFADPTPDEFGDAEEVCPAHFTQLHGQENEKLVKACGPDVIKAVKFDPETIGRDLDRWGACDDVAAILVDGSSGGLGEVFDWARLASLVEACSKPIILAGGLNAGNVAAAIREVRPYGVDVSSGVERVRGEKDPALIEAFCDAVREADR